MHTEYYVCGLFIELRKTFNTVYHKTSVEKLNYCGIRGIFYQSFQ